MNNKFKVGDLIELNDEGLNSWRDTLFVVTEISNHSMKVCVIYDGTNFPQSQMYRYFDEQRPSSYQLFDLI